MSGCKWLIAREANSGFGARKPSTARVSTTNPKDQVISASCAAQDGLTALFRIIADSLGAPHSLPYSFGICHKLLKEIVLVSDQELKEAMKLIFKDLKFALEPTGAAAVAAMLGPQRERLKGQRVGVIMCGSNIDS